MTVYVEDVNDNPPIFPPDGFNIYVSEGAGKGVNIISAAATDKDTGNNSRLTYELLDGNTDGMCLLFTVIFDTIYTSHH